MSEFGPPPTESFKTSGISPMRILENHQHRILPRQHFDFRAERFQRSLPPLLGPEFEPPRAPWLSLATFREFDDPSSRTWRAAIRAKMVADNDGLTSGPWPRKPQQQYLKCPNSVHRRLKASRLVGSAQCASSKIINTGFCRDSTSTCALSASSVLCLRSWVPNSSRPARLGCHWRHFANSTTPRLEHGVLPLGPKW